MTNLAFLFLMQYVISTKAGLVNHVQGPVNVAATESIAAGAPIKTGIGGFAEVLLNPGTFLRVGQNSEVVVDNVELETIAVRVVSGTAVIEAAGVNKKQPITVTTRELTIELIDSGIYMFENGKVSILQGKVRTADSKIEFKKGWQVDKSVAYRAVRVAKDSPSPVETWSQKRSEIMAAMNVQVMTAYRPADFVSENDIWLFSSVLGGYTYVPHRQYLSPYGQRYYSAGSVFRPGREPASAVLNPDSTRSTINPAAAGSADSGGYNPANDRPSYRDIIQEKNAPVGATAP